MDPAGRAPAPGRPVGVPRRRHAAGVRGLRQHAGVQEDIARAAIEAIRAQGRRALVGRGWADLALVDDRDDCFVVGEVNQQALFGRVAAVVHHGGAGTTTTAAGPAPLRWWCPRRVYQPYWAARVAELGIGAAHDGPTPTAESLSAALTTALTPRPARGPPPWPAGSAPTARRWPRDPARRATAVPSPASDRSRRHEPLTTSAFDLPDHLAAKADPALIAGDERHFAAIAESLEQSIADLSDRLDAERKAPGGTGQEAMDRDLEVHRLTARLRTLRRFGLDLCLGHMVGADDPEPVYVGRLGLTDSDGSPAAGRLALPGRRAVLRRDPRQPDGTDQPPQVPLDPRPDQRLLGRGVHRRRVRRARAALDDQSAFIASLGSSRSPRMRDVLGTIQADQDAIIRAGSRGALVVDGGPGTGKTVVALHRTAYLLYSDPRLGHRRGGVLFVGPHQPYLAYVADVLPSLGEEGVQTCTLRDLVPEGAAAVVETDPDVARAEVVRGHGDRRSSRPSGSTRSRPPRAWTVETP